MLSVGADVQFRIWDPVLSVMTVKDLNTATRMTAQNAMTRALLRRPLREIQMEKLKISDQLLVGSFSRGRVGGWLLGLALPAGSFEQSRGSPGPQFTTCLKSVAALESQWCGWDCELSARCAGAIAVWGKGGP